MQIYAKNEDGKNYSALEAIKHCNYYCLECGSAVRLRSGIHRRPHFFHLAVESQCRQNGKSMAHLQAQWAIFERLPRGQAFMEYRIPAIGRIADVAWVDKKIVFEIQCSPISKEEVEARNCDYSKEGFHVVWILHDETFNQWRVSAAEVFLRGCPHYFTNMDSEGQGEFYDQHSQIQKGIRKKLSGQLSVELQHPIFEIKTRKWPLHFHGDLDDRKIDSSENILLPMKLPIHKLVLRKYQSFIHTLLEAACQ